MQGKCWRDGYVLGCKLTPDRGELRSRRATTAADNSTIPASIVVQINDAQFSARVQAISDLGIVFGKEGAIEGTTESAANEILPSDRNTESVQLVIFDEVVHLILTGGRGVNVGTAVAVCVHSEIEAGDVDSGVLDFAFGGRGGSCGGGLGGRGAGGNSSGGCLACYDRSFGDGLRGGLGSGDRSGDLG